MSSERIRVDDLPPFNAAEHLDSVPAFTAYLTDALRADSPELLQAAHEREGLRSLDVEAVARAIEAGARAPLPELRQALAEFDATRARLHAQRSAARRCARLLNTAEEDAAIDAGIEAEPDTRKSRTRSQRICGPLFKAAERRYLTVASEGRRRPREARLTPPPDVAADHANRAPCSSFIRSLTLHPSSKV